MSSSRKIAIVTPITPYPPDSGTKLRIYHLIRILKAAGLRILLVNYDHNIPHEIPDTIRKWCDEFVHIGLDANDSAIPLYKRLYNKFTKVPFIPRPNLTEELSNILLSWEPDFVQVEKTISAAYLDIPKLKAAGMRIVLEEGGVHHLYYEREAAAAESFIKKALNLRRAGRLKSFEKEVIGKVDAVVAVSHEEASLLRKMNPNVNVIYTPNGVDENIFTNEITPAGQRHWGAFFCGNLAYRPNRDAVDLYLHHVMPILKKGKEQLDLVIAGGGPQDDLLAIHDPLFHPLGYVNDISMYFKMYAIFVNPMRLGGGTNLKMLEAMAYGMACVTTAIGAEGIGIESGKHAIVAQTFEEMADYLCRLSDNKTQATLLGAAARQFIIDYYTWPDCAKQLIAYYNS